MRRISTPGAGGTSIGTLASDRDAESTGGAPRVRLVAAHATEATAGLHRFRPGMRRQLGFALGNAGHGLKPSLPLLVRSLELLARELAEPLELQLGLVSVDGSGAFNRPPTPGHVVLRTHPILPLRRAPEDPTNVRRISSLGPEAAAKIERWIRTTIDHRSTSSGRVWWESLYCSQALVRLPDAVEEAELTFGGDTFISIERRRGARWLAESGNGKSGPPLILECILCRDVVRVGPANEPIYEYSMELCLEFCWSLWTKPASPGRALVDEVAAKLVALGWSDWGFDTELPRRRDAASSIDVGRIFLHERIRRSPSDEVRIGTIRGPSPAPALVTLTWQHDDSYTELARRLMLPFDGIAPLEWVGRPDPGVPFSDALVERLPLDARPASHESAYAEPVLARLGADVARVLAMAHAAGALLIYGVQPSLIYVTGAAHDPRFSCLVPRGPNFVALAPKSFNSGPRCYRIPYWAPESFRGRPEAASDVFALCTSLYMLGTGQHPFGDPVDLSAIIARILSGAPAPWPGSGDLGAVLAAGMSPRPEDRPSAGALLEMLMGISKK